MLLAELDHGICKAHGGAAFDVRPAKDVVLEIRDLTSRASKAPAFLVHCLCTALENIKAGLEPSLMGLSSSPGLEYRLYFWPPGMAARPHEHVGWTVSSVLANTLHIDVYDLIAARRDRILQVTCSFTATAGNAGYIYGHGIHSPANLTTYWAASFHVLWAKDQPILTSCVPPVRGLYADAKLVPIQSQFFMEKGTNCIDIQHDRPGMDVIYDPSWFAARSIEQATAQYYINGIQAILPSFDRRERECIVRRILRLNKSLE